LFEPEIHLGEDIVVPDLGGWRRERWPAVGATQAYATVAPDWICEVLSPGTSRFDRAEKLSVYARERVGHAWLVDPAAKTLEVLRLESGRWSIVAVHAEAAKARAEPFDAIELDLAILWADVAE
jgi:Uma2 family endonuclease